MRMSQQDLPNKSGRVINRSELRIETGSPQISCTPPACSPSSHLWVRSSSCGRSAVVGPLIRCGGRLRRETPLKDVILQHQQVKHLLPCDPVVLETVLKGGDCRRGVLTLYAMALLMAWESHRRTPPFARRQNQEQTGQLETWWLHRVMRVAR